VLLIVLVNVSIWIEAENSTPIVITVFIAVFFPVGRERNFPEIWRGVSRTFVNVSCNFEKFVEISYPPYFQCNEPFHDLKLNDFETILLRHTVNFKINSSVRHISSKR
jgi:hypothetical protein